MPRMFAATSVLAAILYLGVSMGVQAAEPVSRRDAARLQQKIQRIADHNGARRGKVAARTAITEAEVNSYLRYEMGDRLPDGVTDPWVSLLDNGRVSGSATVDLARVGKSRKSGGVLDPFSYLAGSVPVNVNGVLRTKNGVGSFALESAAISGVPVPAWMLQEIVTFYSKSPSSPNGVALDRPFVLPSGIREIQLAKGQAIVVQ